MNKCGYVAVIGRPNVGKSTLINRIVGEKVSIVTAKPQTTRHQILAIHSSDQGQILFIDTPGMHVGQKKALNKYMNRAAASAVLDVDLILFLVEAMKWAKDDDQALKALEHTKTPVLLVVNKSDQIKNKEKLLPFVHEVFQKYNFQDIYYTSASKGKGVEDLTKRIYTELPESENYYQEDQLTDKSTKYLISELIREQLMLRLHQEIPYSLTVEVESYKDKGDLVHIHALIWTEREIQKNMVIGKGGETLKSVGSLARREIESLVSKKVNLKLWARVKSAWANSDRLLQELGYKDEGF